MYAIVDLFQIICLEFGILRLNYIFISQCIYNFLPIELSSRVNFRFYFSILRFFLGSVLNIQIGPPNSRTRSWQII
jgi:hypothetical protein